MKLINMKLINTALFYRFSLLKFVYEVIYKVVSIFCYQKNYSYAGLTLEAHTHMHSTYACTVTKFSNLTHTYVKLVHILSTKCSLWLIE